MKFKALLAALVLGLLAHWSPVLAQGYQVQPMLATLEPAGSKSRLTMLIKNTGAVPITLEMFPFRATVDAAGNATRIDEDKDILVYPAQTAIPPGKEQTVQVRYTGDPSLAQARMYGIRVAQLPVNFDTGTMSGGGSTDIKVAFNFLSHIIVSPPAAKASLTVEDAGRNPQGDLMLRFVNGGDGIVVLSAAHLKLVDNGGKSVALAVDQIKFGSFSALLPKQAREVVVASKDIASLSGPVKSTLDLQ